MSVAKADQACVFIDAADYYESLYVNLPKAEKSIVLLGWDFDSRLELIRNRNAIDPRYPVELGKFLRALAVKKPSLQIYILAWDYATYYLPMRELFQKIKFQRSAGSNIHFVFDGKHPLGASHHQKIAVIDGVLAYCGGMDLTSHRWDTSKHRTQDPRRKTASGKRYGPHHDVAIGVTGEAAQALYQVCLQRLSNTIRGFHEQSLEAAERVHIGNNVFEEPVSNVSVAISRTLPAFLHQQEVREVEAWYVEMIGDAKKYIYIENQYLTAAVIVDALVKRLECEDCPEILVILPKKQTDPASEYTMGVMTSNAITRLRSADQFGKLYIGYPEDPALDKELFKNIHSKMICVDDECIRIGSANLNNRSMGLDSECDVTLLAEGKQRLQNHFRKTVAKLFSHHFRLDPDIVQQEWENQHLSFQKTIPILAKKSSTYLVEFSSKTHGPWKNSVANISLVDLDKTVLAERIADRLISNRFDDGAAEFFRVFPVGMILTIVSSMVFLFLNSQYDIFTSLPMDLLGQSFLLFSLAAVSLLPYSVVVVYFATLFGYSSFAYVLIGSCFSAIIGYIFGFIAGKSFDHLPGRWLPLVDERFKNAKFWSVFWSRFFPFAPFALVSFFCGRHGVRFSRYVVGSLVGVAPYCLLVVVIQSMLVELISNFNILNAIFFGLVLFSSIYCLNKVQKRFIGQSVKHSDY